MEAERERIRVLVVDPNREVRTRLAEVLPRLAGLDVMAVGRLSQAREALQQWQPRVVLLETKRRDGQGIALCREIVDRAPGVRVLVVTSYLDPWERFEALLAGAAGYLLKEVDADGLAGTVERVALRADGERAEV